MKFNNEDLVSIADDCISSLELAKSELEDVEEYEEVFKNIEEDIAILNELKIPYEEELQKQWEQEDEDQNSEYERSVL